MPDKRKSKRRRTDLDNPAWTAEMFRRARPARDVLPELYGKTKAKAMLRPRGRPKSAVPRESISLRLPQEVLARWKASGPGWQSRMIERLSRVK